MQDFIRDAVTGFDYVVLPPLIYNSTRAILAMTAAFAGTQRRRDAALRALRILTRRTHDGDDHPRP
ncbi:hypothetical protein H7J93_16475 [Mycobacterium barrassiae]|uniref:hypothetical protein n=1 Tax=Mycobacterium barrassiae TaxID=319709 RepID=UPI002265BB2B|nr:hypothetical protein [Mycobacterium barrassiae]MCV7301216.1 hypothetical protein [Mycobacterium barrassiae]